jgi:hypothetical protein
MQPLFVSPALCSVLRARSLGGRKPFDMEHRFGCDLGADNLFGMQDGVGGWFQHSCRAEPGIVM